MDLRQDLKQTQQLMMLPQMQQALALLQMPVMELSAMIDTELEQNPVLEYEENYGPDDEEEAVDEQEDRELDILEQLAADDRTAFEEYENCHRAMTSDDAERTAFMESLIQETPSLYEHLMEQAAQTFDDEEDRAIAQVVIGNLNDYGFLEMPTENISAIYDIEKTKLHDIIAAIQDFEPQGVGAKDLKESLLIQLRCQDKENTTAYDIVENHYDDMLHNRVPVIQKNLHHSAEEIYNAIHEDIAALDIHPGLVFSKKTVPFVTPDVTIQQKGNDLHVVVNDDDIPEITINTTYLAMLRDKTTPEETKTYLNGKVTAGRWLVRAIGQRNKTLFSIVTVLAKKQKEFFTEPTGKLQPLIMKTVAEEVDVNESTIARAVANKYVDSPRGIIPLRSFFTTAYATTQGEEISAKTVKAMVKKIVERENKKKPLSDQKISETIKDEGVECARRTVAKYRYELSIASASQRKNYC